MNTPELVEWQRIDPDNGLVEPWWTWPCMEVIKTWDLSNKTWLEFGAGLGTSWLRKKCKWVDSIETNIDWCVKASLNCIDQNGRIYVVQANEGMQLDMPKYFQAIPKDTQYDIISVDGIFRNECLQWAIDHFKGRGGILVVDNLNQDFVWHSPAAMELMSQYECQIFIQPGHINHEGCPWNTRIYTIPA